MHKNIQWIWIILQYIGDSYMLHPRHTYNIENGWWGRLIYKILTRKKQKVGNSWNHENPYGGGGSGVYTYMYVPLQFHCSFPLFTSIFTRGRKKWGEGDSVFKHVNLRKSVCYDEKWVGWEAGPAHWCYVPASCMYYTVCAWDLIERDKTVTVIL